ncbi:undecaprenyl-phosphate glucose phosphotransferase [Cucumibacter marinus]|uniref:undecaprenyl-phosphate glucose phosphotransferase n=1 Tax=Cucumibacter marinus TaxID=1121252 RepID=UPI001FDF3AED|nr:undecaprenyl-phosphate glucose phosphotransferase [Cucumibacter marinus]
MSGAVVSGLSQLFEALLLVTLGAAIFYSYLGPGQEVPYGVAIFISLALYNVIANAWGLHKISAYRTLLTQSGRVLASWSIVFLLLTAFMFLFKLQDSYSRVWLVSYYALGAVSLILFRLSLRALVMHWSQDGRLRRRTVIVGGGKDAEELINRIEASAQSDIQLFGLFDDRDDERSPEVVAGYRKLGRVSDLIEFARRTRVDLVIVSMPLSAETRVLHMLKQLWVLPVDIRLSAHMSKLQFKSRAYSYLGDVAVFDMADKPISDWNVILKWCFDKFVAITALTLLSPIMIATAIAIKLDSKGPVLFRQKRHGFNNELIDVFKFRSMYADMSDAKADKLVTRDDPRVTRVGRFIRKTSIDELPQLFNVLKGELSVIGPRPHALEAKAANMLYHEAVDGYFARHKVKPGITGWAQIHGWRGETDTIDKIMQRVNHDLYYIENWSIFLDAYILLMTPFSLVSKNENAF